MTAPAPTSLGQSHADTIAAASVQRYGRPRDQVEAAIGKRFRSEGLRRAATKMSDQAN